MVGSPFRSLVLRVAADRRFRRAVVEGRLGRGVASRFVAGETLDEAVAAARELDRRGIATMLDHLGENVVAPGQAAAAAAAYVRAAERIREEGDLDCQISIKLSQLGVDFSNELCVSQIERVLAAAAEAGTLVMIDMESHAYVDRTLAIYRDLRERHEGIGVCLQSYLRRTPDDLAALPEGSIVRLVKGAYLESPDIALPRRRDVDGAFARLFASLLARGHTVHVGTHDPKLLEGARRLVEHLGIGWSRVEFQMLYGIRRDLQGRLAREGCPVRVYVPYGREWYPYLTRRLAERPANMWFFVSNLMRSTR